MTDPRNIVNPNPVAPTPEPPAPKHLAENEQDHWLSNGLYDVIKFLALILFPALGTLYFALADIWGLPNAQQVVGSITAFDAFLGLLLRASTSSYNNSQAKFDGAINVVPTETGKTYSLELKSDPAALDQKDQVLFKVNTPAA